jgi:hypothetical protein
MLEHDDEPISQANSTSWCPAVVGSRIDGTLKTNCALMELTVSGSRHASASRRRRPRRAVCRPG